MTLKCPLCMCTADFCFILETRWGMERWTCCSFLQPEWNADGKSAIFKRSGRDRMGLAFRILILLASFLFGLICVRSPMTTAKLIVRWAKLVSWRGTLLAPRSREAVFLMENDPIEYAKRFEYQLATIRRTGMIAITVALIGSCIMAFSH